MKLTFQPLNKSNLSVLKSMFKNSETKTRLSPINQHWLDYVNNNTQVFAWIIHNNDAPIGHSQVDIDANNIASVAVTVEPNSRNRGYCKQILKSLINRPELKSTTRIDSHIDEDNLASRKRFSAAGFVQQLTRPNKDGLIKYSCQIT